MVLVGDTGCGKSALAYRLMENVFLYFHEPTGFDNYNIEMSAAEGSCNLNILDTSGIHEDGGVRALTYQKSCDAIILCFDLTDQSSLTNTEKFWLPEIQKHCPNVPFYIAGCKKDSRCVTRCNCDCDCCTQTENEFLEIVERSGAVAFMECSALVEGGGIQELFQAVIKSRKRKNSAQYIISKIKQQTKTVRRRLSLQVNRI